MNKGLTAVRDHMAQQELSTRWACLQRLFAGHVFTWGFCAPETEGQLFQKTAITLAKWVFSFLYFTTKHSQPHWRTVIFRKSTMTHGWLSVPQLRWPAKDHSFLWQRRSMIRNKWGQHQPAAAFTVVEMCILTYSYLLEARAKACLLEIWRENCTARTNILHIHTYAHTHASNGTKWGHTLFRQTTLAALFDARLRVIHTGFLHRHLCKPRILKVVMQTQ